MCLWLICRGATRRCLDQAAHTQVLLNDDIVDGSHDEADLHCVGRTREVSVDLLGRMLVEAKRHYVSLQSFI